MAVVAVPGRGSVVGRALPRLSTLIPVVYWGGLYVALFAGFIARSWYGVVSLRRTLVPTLARAGMGSAEGTAGVPDAAGG